MTEAIESKSKSKAAPNAFEMPKFEMPKFDMPKMEMPAAFREFAENGVAQAKDTYEKMKSAAEEATDVLENTYSTATKGASDYGLKVIEAARANTNAAFDFASEIMTAKSLSEVVELSTSHARKQFEALTAQTKELSRARAEGRHRDRRADQGRHDTRHSTRSPEGSSLRPQPVHAAQSPGSLPGLFACGTPRSTRLRRKPSRRGPCQSRTLLLASAALPRPRSRAAVAQLVRAPDCGSGGRWFESTQLYQIIF